MDRSIEDGNNLPIEVIMIKEEIIVEDHDLPIGDMFVKEEIKVEENNFPMDDATAMETIKVPDDIFPASKDDQNAGHSKMSPCAERLLYDTHSSDSSQRVSKKYALKKEWNQRYHDRHREEINQRKRDMRLRRQSLQPIASCLNVQSIQPIQQDEVSSKQMDTKDALRKERDRRYRERHREEINQRKRKNRQRQQNVQHIATASNVYNTDAIQQITEAIPDHQSSSNCSNLDIIPEIRKKYNQRYHDRHQDEINQHTTDTRLNQQSVQPIASCSNVNNIQPIQLDDISSKQVNKKDAVRKERNRRYRERHREEINRRKRKYRQRQQNVQHIATAFNVYNIDAIQQITEPLPD